MLEVSGHAAHAPGKVLNRIGGYKVTRAGRATWYVPEYVDALVVAAEKER